VTKLGKVDEASAASATSVAAPASASAPHDPGAGLGEHEVKAILDYRKKHPSMGPAQIRAQLKRFLGWRISVKAIARVLRKAGYAPVHRKGRPVGDEHPRRFEAPHRNSLWQLDFTELRVGSERRWLLVIEDDFSRFVVGHVLAEGPTSEVVVAAMREAIRFHGKPERVYTDRGAAFTAWLDVTSCEQFLDEQVIDHSLRKAHRPQGGGKIESVIGTVQREDPYQVSTTASGWNSAKSATSATRRVAGSAAWQPASDGACDHEPHGNEAVVKVTLRPPATANWFPFAVGPRGKCRARSATMNA
jgi:transposase InsO family protein